MNLHKLDTISFTWGGGGGEGTATRRLPKISIPSDKTKSLMLKYPSKVITLFRANVDLLPILIWTSLPLVKQRWTHQILLIFLKSDKGHCNENKGKDRPAQTSNVAFVIVFKLYFFSHQRVFKGFSFFVRDDRRFRKNFFQQRLIVYQTPLLHQYSF